MLLRKTRNVRQRLRCCFEINFANRFDQSFKLLQVQSRYSEVKKLKTMIKGKFSGRFPLPLIQYKLDTLQKNRPFVWL